MVAQLGSIWSLCDVSVASLAGSWKARKKPILNKARMVEEQGGAMTPSSCLFVIFPHERH